MAKRIHRTGGVRVDDNEGNTADAPRRRATAVKPGGRVVLADGPDKARLFVYLAANYLHRIEHARRELYFGDHDLAIVAETIGAAAVEPGMRDAEFRDVHKGFDTVVEIQEMRAINATSIANASGIPRETVRRKLAQLVQHGFIVEKARSHYVLKPGVLLEPHRRAAFARGIEQTVRFVNDLLEQGVIRWVSAEKAKQGSLT